MDTEPITLTTPALLFPAVSLLLLAFTNRYLALANLIRNLHARYQDKHENVVYQQIHALRKRLLLIRNMQALGVTSLLLCVICMFVLFAGYQVLGKWIFGTSLVVLMMSLAVSVREIGLSANALNLQLSDLEEEGRKK